MSPQNKKGPLGIAVRPSRLTRTATNGRARGFAPSGLRPSVQIAGAISRTEALIANKPNKQKKPTPEGVSFSCLARPERFERPTLGFVDRCSIQLSYGRIKQ